MAVGGVRRRIRQGHAGQRIQVAQAGAGLSVTPGDPLQKCFAPWRGSGYPPADDEVYVWWEDDSGVVQRQPADNHVVGVEIDAKSTANQQLVSHQIAVGDLYALGHGGVPEPGLLRCSAYIGDQYGQDRKSVV